MSKPHVLEGLRQFIETVTANKNNKEAISSPSLIKISLHLLDELPASREIIFEYFASLAEISVQSYVENNNVDAQTGLPLHHPRQGGPKILFEDNAFDLVQDALENLVCRGPSAWGSVIAAWSMDLVGRLSDNYTKRKMSISASCNYWLNCSAMRGLLTLISASFRKLSNTEADSCVSSLLNAFLRYTMTFDWVLARLGGYFPEKIITQLLNCSLKRFSDDYRCIFESEIEILDYLCLAHEQELKTALREILQDGFHPKKGLDASIIPFCMVLANCSDALLQSLVSVFLDMYNEELCTVLIQKAPLWMSNKLFAEMQSNMFNIALRLKAHGAPLLVAVAKTADLHYWCQDFIEYTLQELEQVILNVRQCPILNDLCTQESKHLLWKSCLSANIYEQQTAVRLLLIVSTQHPHIYFQSISELLRKSYALNQNGLGAVIRMIGGQSGLVEYPDIKPGLQMLLEDVLLQEQFQSTRLKNMYKDDNESLNTFHNLNTLMKMIKKQSSPHLKPHQLLTTLNECLPKILQILEVVLNKLILYMDEEATKRKSEKLNSEKNSNKNVTSAFTTKKQKTNDFNEDTQNDESSKSAQRLVLAHKIIELLNLIESGSKTSILRTTEVLKLSVLTVKYFFVVLSEPSHVQRLAAAQRSYMLFQRQCCARKAARTACLRELVEGALFYYGYLFNQHEEPGIDELEIPDSELVQTQNQRHTHGPNSARTLLHVGVIGRGLRPENLKPDGGCNPEIQNLFLKALESCCAETDQPNSVEGYSMISLLLVELVSTDVMYNGLPFPDEEFTKVTMERDCFIRRSFITSPVLWAITGFIATHRPALCFSSVLLRALCATCLQQWRAKNVNRFEVPNPNEELMQCTRKLLQLLSVGQLLPPPLTQLHMIIDYFEAPEIVLLLRECVWNYLKDHVPSPALFQVDSNGLHWRNTASLKIPPQYVDTLRTLMQKKLTKLGNHYYQMFVMVETNSPAANPIPNTIATTVIPSNDAPSIIEIDP